MYPIPNVSVDIAADQQRIKNASIKPSLNALLTRRSPDFIQIDFNSRKFRIDYQ
jgi:hypothetical protein